MPLALAVSLLLFLSGAPAPSPALILDRTHHEVRITATVQPGGMDRLFGVRGHHLIVWKEGNAHDHALFASDASDHDVRAALDSLGAHRGENLTAASWTARDDPKNPEPDKRVDGTPIDVFIEWPSHARVPVASLLAEKDAPAPRLDFRYGGNERWQKEFHSGCIVCLYSCPGGAVGNRVHPIRDYVRDGVVYSSLDDRLPPSGTKVTVILKPRS